MKCDLCGKDLYISSSKLESPENTNVITCIQKMVCVNPDCTMYSGTDLSNPTKVAKVVNNTI